METCLKWKNVQVPCNFILSRFHFILICTWFMKCQSLFVSHRNRNYFRVWGTSATFTGVPSAAIQTITNCQADLQGWRCSHHWADHLFSCKVLCVRYFISKNLCCTWCLTTFHILPDSSLEPMSQHSHSESKKSERSWDFHQTTHSTACAEMMSGNAVNHPHGELCSNRTVVCCIGLKLLST